MDEMIDSIYSLFIDELDFIEKHSYFTSQSMKNQDECGFLVELAMRKFLKEVIGSRFKITHGYIFSSEKKVLSPQIDIIITDTLVPHTLKLFEHFDNLEIVPVEAVVAIFEVKRTLNKSTLKKATVHLEKIFDAVSLSKTNEKRYFHGGWGIAPSPAQGMQLTAGLLSNPLIGIIGLLHKEGIIDTFARSQDLPWFIDTIFSLGGTSSKGTLLVPRDLNNYMGISALPKRFNKDRIQYNAFHHDRIKMLQNFTAYLITYLNGVSGRIFDVNSCFNLNSE
ncbi:MAG: hypothetical protein K0R12_1311 [Gammaproteobacteria bacterium]|jgi:hypothetical protein|nr:hypothetical protein [Gammaproteobacteria bacterium]